MSIVKRRQFKRRLPMKRSRRHFLRLIAMAAAFAAPLTAHAETYPAHPARIIVAFPAGGPQDITARLIAQWLSDRLGQQFLVERRPVAAGRLHAPAVRTAEHDRRHAL